MQFRIFFTFQLALNEIFAVRLHELKNRYFFLKWFFLNRKRSFSYS